MKKLLSLFCSILCINAFAVITYPVPGKGQLGSFQGAWSNTVKYDILQIKGTYYNAAPIVTNSGSTYIMNNSESAITGVAPGSSSAWSAI